MPKLSKFGQAFVSYGSYHYDPVNQWIHIICVPIIAATLISALSYIPISLTFQGFTLGIDALAIAIVSSYYVSINIVFALGMFVMILLMTAGWHFAFSGMPEDQFLVWVVSIHILAWVFQFIGHGVFEKRKPALLDNLTQILNAPLFVVVEVLGKLGYKSSEMSFWESLIQKRVEQFRQSKGIKSQ